MKNLYIILACLIPFLSYSQDPELFNNTWYLESIIIEDVETFPPNDNDIPFVELAFSESNSELDTRACSSGVGSLDFMSSTNDFFLDMFVATFEPCSNPDNDDFNNLYLDFFFSNIDKPIDYQIIGETNKTLTLISENNDQAVYNNSIPLSVNDISKLVISLYPNPVQEQLFVSATEQLATASIYSITGKLVAEHTLLKTTAINTSKLSQGMYLITIEDIEGNKVTKKFVKK